MPRSQHHGCRRAYFLFMFVQSSHSELGGNKDRRLFYIWIHVGMVPEREGIQKQYIQRFTRSELDKLDKSAGVSLFLLALTSVFCCSKTYRHSHPFFFSCLPISSLSWVSKVPPQWRSPMSSTLSLSLSMEPSTFMLIFFPFRHSPLCFPSYFFYEESDHRCRMSPSDASGGSSRVGSVSEDHADPEGAAAVISGVKNILAGGASLLSSGVSSIIGTGTATQLDSRTSVGTIGNADSVDPLMGQPLRMDASAAASIVCNEERAAMEAEEKAKSVAYAAVEKNQKQL